MLKKETKIKLLENFFTLDYIFFGMPITESKTCCPVLVKDYIATKGALMDVIKEMYVITKYTPKQYNVKVSEQLLHEMAINKSAEIKKNVKGLISSNTGISSIKNLIKESLKEYKTNKISEKEAIIKQKIQEKAFSLSVDNLIIESMVVNSKKYKNLNSWNGKLAEDAYKFLKKELVECACMLADSIEGVKESEKKKATKKK